MDHHRTTGEPALPQADHSPPATAQAREWVSAAFTLMRGMHPSAGEAVVEHHDQEGASGFWLMAVRSAAGVLLWFDEDNYNQHPDCGALGGSPEIDFDRDVVAQVEQLLYRAYTQPGSTGFAPAAIDAYQGMSMRQTVQRDLIVVTAPDRSPTASA